MATYAIGDLQGCYSDLRQLLQQFEFDPRQDRLWLTGDLVNRGPESLEALRYIKSLGDAAVTVLGNHDLHLLAVAEGVQQEKHRDTLAEILDAPDRPALLGWLRHRPLLYREGNNLLVHAGLLPQWTPEQAAELAKEVETALRGNGYRQFLAEMYGNEPDEWRQDLTGINRLRVVINAMTRMRFITREGKMNFSDKGTLDSAPPGYLPWFEAPGRRSAGARIVFGHWSALGLRVAANLLALDTGCVWGNALTAVRLEDGQVFQVACKKN